MLNFKNKPIIGMIHLSGNYPIERAIEEIKIYEDFGIDGIIVENYHAGVSDVIDVLSVISTKLEIGINILPNEYITAFSLAKQFNGSFIQLDYISGTYQRNKSLNLSEYMDVYKSSSVQVLGGVWPKYYTPTSNLDSDLTDAKERCNAIVVTGSGTGKITPLQKIKYFKNFIGDFPLIIGAGMSVDTIEYLNYADGAIVGSAFKKDNITSNMVDKYLVEKFMNAKNKIK